MCSSTSAAKCLCCSSSRLKNRTIAALSSSVGHLEQQSSWTQRVALPEHVDWLFAVSERSSCERNRHCDFQSACGGVSARGPISAAHLWSQPLQWHQAPPPRSQPRRRPPAPRPWQRASHELKTRWTESTTDRSHQTPRARAACRNVHGGNSWRSSRAPSVSGTRSGQLQSLLFS